MKKLMMIVAMVGVIAMAGVAHAGTVFNYVGLGAQSAPAVDPGVSNSDLLHNVVGVVTGDQRHTSFGTIDVVTDGTYTVADAGRFLPDGAAVDQSSTWTFTLDSVSDIGEVLVYAAGDAGLTNTGPRNAYDYDLKFFDGSDDQIGTTITVGSGYGGTLDALGSGTAHVRGNDYPDGGPLPDFNQTHYTQVADDGGVLASGVSKVSFTFREIYLNGTRFATLANATGHAWVTEIDVFADPVAFPVPEPGSFALLALGLGGMLGLKRRK